MTQRADDGFQPDPDDEGGEGAKESTQERNWRLLNADNAAKDDTIKELRAQIGGTVFAKAGFDTDDDGNLTGVGALMAESYDGEMTVKAITESAAEKGIPIGGGTVDQPETDEQKAARLAADVESGQKRVDKATAGSRSLPGADDVSELTKRVEAYDEAGGPVTMDELSARLDLQRETDPAFPQ